MITYKKRKTYKFTLVETYSIQTGLRPPTAVGIEPVLGLEPNGLLTISKGYAWDGASGPVCDTPNLMRGSLVHDALYQLMREEKIGQECRKRADELLHEICLANGMLRFRAWYIYLAVRIFGASSAAPDLRQSP